MENLLITPSLIIPLFSFLLAFISLWLPKRFSGRTNLTAVSFLCALATGLLFGFIHIKALFLIILFAICVHLFYKKGIDRILRNIAGIIIILLSIGLGSHAVPGFNNPKIITDLLLSKNSLPYTLYLNFDKISAGLLLIYFGHKRLTSKNEWLKTLKETLPIAVITIFALFLLSMLSGYVRFEIKIPRLFFVWAAANLFFTCTVEEAFFRGFIQKNLQANLSSSSSGNIISLTVASLLFGLAHYKGGINYIFLSSVAGFGYGHAYQQTSRIEAGIFSHFLLNAVHFIFFTYPALA